MGITFIMICVLAVAVLAITPAIATVVILFSRKTDHPGRPVDSDEPKKTFGFPVVVPPPADDADPPAGT